MEPVQDKAIDLRHYRRLLWRRRGLIVLAAVAVLSGTAVALTFVAPTYQSEVTLLISERQPLAREIEEVLGGNGRTNTGFRADEERLSRMVGRVRSRPFLERVIKILKMTEDPRVREEARRRAADHPGLDADELAVRILVEALQNRIRFSSVGPGLYKIIVYDQTPENAQLLAKWVSELFVDISVQKELEQIRTARTFGEEQQRVYEEQLRRSEEALERTKGSMIGQSLASTVVHAGNLSAAETFYRRLDDEATTAEARVAPLGRAAELAGMAPGDARFAADPSVVALVQRMEGALRSAVEEALTGTGAAGETPRWPPQGSLDVLRRDLYVRLEALAGTFYPEAPAEAKRAMAAWALARSNAAGQSRTASWLQGGIDSMKRRAEAIPAGELEVARLEEVVRRDRELLQSFRAQLVASDVSQAVETTNLGTRIEIIDPAQAPLRPSRPNRPRILLAAVLVGPLLGVAFAVLAEIFDPTLRTLEDIKRVAPEPVFGTLPLLSALAPRNRGLRRYWIPATVGGIMLLTAVFFAAKTTVLHDVGGKQPVRVIDPGEGVSP